MPYRLSRALFCLLVITLPVLAQEFRSTISGSIMDSSQAVIPGAKVVATNTATGIDTRTVSSDTGQFSLPFLIPGKYRVTAEAAGFKTYVRENYEVSTNERYQLDIVLQLGDVAESVTVSEQATLLTTATASIGQVIRTSQIENMPMNGRTPLVLAQLAYGVIPTSDPRFTRPFDNAGPSDFTMGGGSGGAQDRTNELLIDGTPDMTRNRRVAYNPPVDSVTEVKVESFQADAAYGNTGGGTVNVVLKGGTNAFHGTAYAFNQVSKLAATMFFTNAAGQQKPVTRYNQYGVTSGGPLWVPKLFDGRNRAFWYFAWEGLKDSFPEPATTTVPTQAERNGDFSAWLNVGSNYQIYDPMTGVMEGSRIRRQPFSGNIIPANRINAIAKSVLPYFPLPNQAGRADGQDNYLANAKRTDDFNNYMGRLDFNLSDRHRFFWNFRHNDRIEDRSNRFNNIATGNFLTRRNWGTTLDDVYAFGATTMLNTRIGWTRFTEGNQRQSDGFDFTSLGFPASLAAASPHPLMPRFDFSNYNDISDTGGDVTPFDTFQIFSSLTKVVGSHTLKFGTDLRQQRESSASFGYSAGRYDFNTNWTRGPLDNSPGAPKGQDLAAFMLGLPSTANDSRFDVNARRTQHAYYTAFFVQDDWRVRPSLTINAGLRYERETGTVERFNRALAGFDFSAVNRVTEAAKAAYAQSPIALLPVSQFNPLGGVIFTSPDRRNIYSTDSNALSPRFGFAWTPARLGGKTVIRGGVGIFYYTHGTLGIQQTGFSQSTPFVATQDSYLTPFATLSNPFPGGILQPVGSALGVNTYLGQNVTFFNPNVGQPYSARWNFGIQRELSNHVVLEVAYTGNHAVHLTENHDLNFVPREYLSTLPTRDQAAIDRLSALVPNPFRGLLPGTGLNGSTTAAENLLRRFPQFSGNGGVRIEGDNNGSSYFHMMQVRLEKRFSSGLQMLANYQWSKLIEIDRRLISANPFLEKRIGNEDRPHRLVVSGSYELPFGPGKALGSASGPVLARFIGGWVLNGIFIVQPGAPLNWEDRNSIYYGGDLNLDPHRVNGSFDTTRFQTDSRAQLDRNLRTFPSRFANLRQDGVKNVDLSVIKDTRITERVSLQYRFEAFNTFNRPTFNAPSLNPTDRNFGEITSQANLNRTVQMALRLKW